MDNLEIASADRMTLHLSEIGRLQNNAGSVLQFTALIFVICVYYFNALIYPNSPHRAIYAAALIITASFVTFSCVQFARCLMKATLRGRSGQSQVLSNATESELEALLLRMARNFRTGAAAFFIGLFSTFILLCLLALASTGQLT